MILVSFSSAEDVLSNDVKIYNTFSLQCTEKPPFRFFWDTRYIYLNDDSIWEDLGLNFGNPLPYWD